MENLVRRHFQERIKKGEYLVREKMILLPKVQNSKGKLLDVGCGATPTYSKSEFEIYGVDITPQMAKMFQKSNREACVVIADAKALPFQEGKFDIVIANALLHHLVSNNPRKCKHNIRTAIKEMKSVLKPNGIISVRELIVKNKLFSLVMFYVTFLCSKLNIEMELFDIHSSVVTFFLARDQSKKLFKKMGLRIVDIKAKDWRMFEKIKLGTDTQFLLERSPQDRIKNSREQSGSKSRSCQIYHII